MLFACKLELLLLVLRDDVAEFPLELALGTKLKRDFECILVDPLPMVGLTSWGILFGDLIDERVAFVALSFIGDDWELPICVVFTGFALT